MPPVKKLFSGLQRKGGNLNLSGQAPYKLKIGAPAAVQIQFLGKPVDLSRFIRTNRSCASDPQCRTITGAVTDG